MGRCPLVFIWADIAKIRMPSSSIVEQLDIFKQALPCLLSGSIVLMVNQLSFKATEEALSHCVVVAIAFATHTAPTTIISNQ